MCGATDMKTVLTVTLLVYLLSPSYPVYAGTNPDRSLSPDAQETRAHSDLPESVTLTAQQVKDRGITVANAPTGAVGATIRAPATAQFVRDRVSKIGPRLPAKVVKATVALGDHVAAGDTVAILDSVELGKVKSRYLAARATLELAREAYDREQRLVAQKISSKAELQQARAGFEQAQAELDATIEELRLYGQSRKAIDAIRAGADQPFSRYALITPQAGIVEELDVTPGQTLTPEMTPIEVVDRARMWVMIDAFEKDAGRIKPGQHVVFEARAIPDAKFAGVVDWVAQELSPTTRTVQVQATVTNTNGALRAGMFGTTRIEAADTTEHPMLPIDAIQTIDGKTVVFKPVPGKPNTFAVVPVTTGEEAADRVAVLAGVSPGEPVVIKGAFALMSILTAGSRQDTD